MERVKNMLRLCLVIFIYSWAEFLLALPPPESYQLLEYTGKNPLDSKLKSWLTENKLQKHVSRLSDKEYQSLLDKKDQLSKDFINLKRFAKDEKELLKIVPSILKRLEQYERATNQHPLYPYLLDEILQYPKLEESLAAGLESSLRRFGKNSCPQKDLILDEIDRAEDGFKNVAAAMEVLSRIREIKDDSFRENALEDFLDILSASHRGLLREVLIPLVSGFDKIKEDHDWLMDAKEKEPAKKNSVLIELELAEKAARRRRCNTAKRHLLRALKKDKEASFLVDVEESAKKVGGCYRRKGSLARIRFWRGMRRHFKKTYGFAGDAYAHSRMGSIYWGRDDFEVAKKIYTSIYDEAKEGGHKEIEASSLNTLGRIAENEGEFKDAISYFEKFVRLFKGHKEHLSALKSLVLMTYDVGDKKLAKKYIKEIIEMETLKAVDDRDALLSFGLFWGGRVYYEGGEYKKAEHYWRRGASEFYSSFYGALSHYVLEKSRQVHYKLQPSRSPVFNFAKLTKSLDQKDKDTHGRVIELLKLGMKGSVSCEIEELDNDPEDSAKVLLVAMLKHTSGQWLQSIQRFSSLPRSYRHVLPSGFERLLFPRTYEDFVKKFSKRLRVDADLVYSIIRQESVFNPRAISPVGARGLMQLMPATARLEARRLGKGYVSRSRRKSMIRQSRNRRRLLDVETNLTLGVHHVRTLMTRYNNPVFLLTSYNASPSATKRWRGRLLGKDMLTFIERIPYKETKLYVKFVMRNYFYYKRWYGSNKAKLPYLDHILPRSLMKKGPIAQGKRDKKEG